jgi:hypothetical protein
VNLLNVCPFVVIHALAKARCRLRSFLVHCVVILPEPQRAAMALATPQAARPI